MYKSLFTLIFALLLTACSSDDNKVKAGKYGMMSQDTPQYTAILFMRAIYNQNDLNKAVELSTPRFAKRLRSLHTAKSVQRQVFNLRLTKMEAEPVTGGTLITSDSQKDAKIEMKIVGEYERNKVVDLKKLIMKKINGNWKVADVKKAVP